jgi:lipopolysaccharide transport system permease protein
MSNQSWDRIIEPKKSWFSLDLRELIKHKDLLFLFFKRDVVSVYKQTILGPVWFFVQPIITSLVFTLIFGNMAKISTDGLPAFLFYLTGMTLWNYFASTVTNNANIFGANQTVFGKVYFPRLLVPMSNILANLLKFSLQFIIFIGVWEYYVYNGSVVANSYALLLPINLVFTSFMGLGIGLILSSYTVKYRDLNFLVGFGVQLLMYGSSIIFPLSIVSEKLRNILQLNPMTNLIECTKKGFLGKGIIDTPHLIYSYVLCTIILFIGMLLFNKKETTFIDTV